ncbi:MAG: DUF6491 family protein, partial [Caulobacteraceae bacterium]
QGGSRMSYSTISWPTISWAAVAAAGVVAAGAPAAVAGQTCFLSRDWQGWKSPSPKIIYLRVNVSDIYKVTLSVGSSMLQSPDVHLDSIVRGSSNICSAIDLDLRVSDNNGFATPLIAESLTKLTPEEIAAIPKKYRP